MTKTTITLSPEKKREKLHPPIDEELMQGGVLAKIKIYPTDEFISQCHSFGIQTNETELNQYEKEGLLLRVFVELPPNYSREQIFAVEAIQKSKTLSLHEMDVNVDQKTWNKKQQQYKDIFKQKQEGLREEIERRYKIIEIYYATLRIQKNLLIYKKKKKEEHEKRWKSSPINADILGYIGRWRKDIFPEELKQILQKYEIRKADLLNYAKYFAMIGFSVDPMINSWEKIYSLPKQSVWHEHGKFHFARLCYNFSETIGWLLQGEREKPPSLKDWYKERNLFYDFFPIKIPCKTCEEFFEPKKGGRKQVNCSKKCEKEYRKKKEKERRQKKKS